MKQLFAFFFVLICVNLNFSQPSTESVTNAANSTSSTNESFVNVVRPTVTIPKFSAEPVIDGKLDDEIWKSGAVFKDLIQTQPGDNIRASKPTEIYIGYDEKHFYIAFKCWDEKDKIRATVAQRDGVFGEDNVRFWLDTYDDKRRAYIFGFNPFGIQQDGIYTEGQGADFNVDILFESKGVIEDWGWSVEAKIPFKSLRYVAGKGKFWGFNVARNIDRLNDEFNSWVPLPRGSQGFLNKFGKITGLDEIKNERTLEVIPTLTLKETGKRVSQTKFSNPPIQPDFGFTAKYTITPNVTLDMAYNPDFADTEADAPVVEANQRFPIFFSEKRPFFLEGVEIFQTPIQAVYTRRVENPDVAVKLTGKIGRNSFGIFGAVDDPLNNPFNKKAFVGVVRLKRDFGEESNIGFLATSYTYPEKHNQLAGFDTRWRLNKNSQFRGQFLASHSKNNFYIPSKDDVIYKTGNGFGYNYQYNYSRKNFGWGFGGEGASTNFRADMGFTRRTNSMQNYFYMELDSDPKPKSFIISKSLNTSFGVRNDFAGRFQGWGMDVNLNFSLKGNTQVGGGGSIGPEKIYEDEFGAKRGGFYKNGQPIVGAFFGEPTRDAFGYGGFGFFYRRFNKRYALNSNFSMFRNSFDYDFGAGRKFPRVSPAALSNKIGLDPGAGTSLDFSLNNDFRITDSFNLNVGYSKSHLHRYDTDRTAFDSNIFSLRSSYQFSRFVNVKSIVNYNTLNGRISGQYTFGWTPSPGKALYIGYNDRWLFKTFAYGQQQPGFIQQDRTFFIKMSYLFRKSF